LLPDGAGAVIFCGGGITGFKAARWDTSTLPVPAQVLVYTLEEWDNLNRQSGRFAQMLKNEVIWV